MCNSNKLIYKSKSYGLYIFEKINYKLKNKIIGTYTNLLYYYWV